MQRLVLVVAILGLSVIVAIVVGFICQVVAERAGVLVAVEVDAVGKEVVLLIVHALLTFAAVVVGVRGARRDDEFLKPLGDVGVTPELEPPFVVPLQGSELLALVVKEVVVEVAEVVERCGSAVRSRRRGSTCRRVLLGGARGVR